MRHLPLGSVVFCEQRFHRDVDPVEMLLFFYFKHEKCKKLYLYFYLNINTKTSFYL